jgi:hypothetical protein
MSDGERQEGGVRGDPGAATEAGGTAAGRSSGWRELLLAIVAVGLFFALLEGVLAILGVEPLTLREDPFLGFAGSAPLYLPETGVEDEPYLVTAPARVDLFNKQRFPRRKPSGGYRIFCLGGSTTIGRPYDDATSFAGWLRELLPVVDPSRRWEVINAGGVSYASYRVVRILRELVDLEPDLFVVYTGQNEFLEERTYPALRRLPAPVKALAVALSGTRTWATMDALMTRVGVLTAEADTSRDVLPRKVDARLDHAVGLDLYRRDDELRARILRHYRVSLERMVAIARSAGARVVFVAPASNLRSCSPFKSQHTAGLAPSQRLRSRRLLEAAREHARMLAWSEALATLNEAIGLDPRFAELHYQRGRALFALGRYAEAKAAFERARDEDVCPLRALGEMESILRRVAEESGSLLVDFKGLLEANLEATAGHAILGEEDFLDHVHPTIAGHRTLALALMAPEKPEIAVARYPSGRARSVAQTSLDAAGRTVLDGLYTEWRPSGTLRRVVSYVDGVPRGAGVSWDATGERSG